MNKKEYNFVFWADVPGNTHYAKAFGTTPGEQVLAPTVTVNYGTNANDESRDAFFGKITGLVVDGTMNERVELTRPFAQINFATADTEAARIGGFVATQSSFATYAYTTLDLVSGVAANPTEVTLVSALLPADNGVTEKLYLQTDTEKKNGYDWLGMNYILWNEAEGSLSTCTMVVSDDKGQSVEVKYPNAPVKRNWRTNLVGNLLTDQVVIEVEILPVPENEYVGVISVGTEAEFNAAFADPNVHFIVLDSDIVLTKPVSRSTGALLTVSAGESINIDLNKCKLSASTDVLFDVKGELVIANGVVENKGGEIFTDDSVVENVTIVSVTVQDSEGTIFYDEENVSYNVVSDWAEFTAALAAGEAAIMLGADITCEKAVILTSDVLIDLNGKTLEAENISYIGIGDDKVAPTVIIKNGSINGRVYALYGNTTLSGITFGGAISYLKAAQGVINAKSGNLTVENCDVSKVTVSGTGTKPRTISTDGRSSGLIKLVNSNFSNIRLERAYINMLSGSAALEFVNCKFRIATNIDTSKTYALTNMALTGNSGGFTFTVNRAQADMTEADWEHLRLIKSQNSGTTRVDCTDKQKITSF